MSDKSMNESLKKAECLEQKSLYPWAEFMKETDFISSEPSYPSGQYLPLFEDKVFETKDPVIGDLRYYVYDPTKHGMPSDRKYPVLFALHGSGGSLVEKLAVNWAAAEMFASPEYQKMLGGAYIIAPLANEYRGEDGRTEMSWMISEETGLYPGYTGEDMPAVEQLSREVPFFSHLLGHNSIYTKALYELLDNELASMPCAGDRILFGTSAGGYSAWRMLITRPDFFTGTLIMAGAYLPSRSELKAICDAGKALWICHGKYDECVPYKLVVEPILDALKDMPRTELFLPDIVRRADGGVASNIAGDFQMGQHCINDVVHENLMYLDGTPIDPNHPDGVIGWIKGLIQLS